MVKTRPVTRSVPNWFFSAGSSFGTLRKTDDAIEFGLGNPTGPAVVVRESYLEAALVRIELHCNPAR